MLASNDALEARLRHVETKPALDLDAVDAAIQRIRRPDVVRDQIGDALLYAQRVEAEVGGLSIETLLPHSTDDYVGRFLTVWVPDEQGHGEAQARLARSLGLQPYEPRPEDAVPLHNRAAGFLARLLPRVKGMIEMTYHTIGAINERLALEAYRRMAAILEHSGEHEMAKVLMVPMRNDEAAHLSYYRTYRGSCARRWRRGSSPSCARSSSTRTHRSAPVSAADKAPLGRALLQLESDPDNPGIATSVQSIAEELLADGAALRPFVHQSLRKCVALARAPAAA